MHIKGHELERGTAINNRHCFTCSHSQDKSPLLRFVRSNSLLHGPTAERPRYGHRHYVARKKRKLKTITEYLLFVVYLNVS